MDTPIAIAYRVATRAAMTDALNFDRSYRHLPMLVHCVHGVGDSGTAARSRPWPRSSLSVNKPRPI